MCGSGYPTVPKKISNTDSGISFNNGGLIERGRANVQCFAAYI